MTATPLPFIWTPAMSHAANNPPEDGVHRRIGRSGWTDADVAEWYARVSAHDPRIPKLEWRENELYVGGLCVGYIEMSHHSDPPNAYRAFTMTSEAHRELCFVPTEKQARSALVERVKRELGGGTG